MLAAVLVDLVRLVAPILSFTAEEVWQFTSESLRGEHESVHLAAWPERRAPSDVSESLREAYAVVHEVRDAVTKALEEARNADVIGKSQEARLQISAPSQMLSVLEERGIRELAQMFIVSDVTLTKSDQIEIQVLSATGAKCPRCWNYRPLGTDQSHSEVCARCSSVLADQVV